MKYVCGWNLNNCTAIIRTVSKSVQGSDVQACTDLVCTFTENVHHYKVQLAPKKSRCRLRRDLWVRPQGSSFSPRLRRWHHPVREFALPAGCGPPDPRLQTPRCNSPGGFVIF